MYQIHVTHFLLIYFRVNFIRLEFCKAYTTCVPFISVHVLFNKLQLKNSN